MTNLRTVLVAWSAVFGSVAVGAMGASGCGSNSSGTPPTPEGGMDSTVDSPPDVSPPPPDVQADVPTEAGGDGGEDAPADVVASDSDAGPIPAFLSQVATALCTKLQTCCRSQLPDGAAFNMSACITGATENGYQGTTFGATDQQAVLNFNATRAAACLNDINVIDCTTNVITSAQQQALLTDCIAAVNGSLGANASCTYSIQCAAGFFCDTPTDGGTTGTCQPLRGDGGACGNFGDIPANNADYSQGELACSDRGTGNTGLFCFERDLTTGNPIPGTPGTWACRPAGGVDAGCNLDQECASGLCNPGQPGFGYTAPDGAVSFGSIYTCASSTLFAYLNTCLPFAQ